MRFNPMLLTGMLFLLGACEKAVIIDVHPFMKIQRIAELVDTAKERFTREDFVPKGEDFCAAMEWYSREFLVAYNSLYEYGGIGVIRRVGRWSVLGDELRALKHLASGGDEPAKALLERLEYGFDIPSKVYLAIFEKHERPIIKSCPPPIHDPVYGYPADRILAHMHTTEMSRDKLIIAMEAIVSGEAGDVISQSRYDQGTWWEQQIATFRFTPEELKQIGYTGHEVPRYDQPEFK